MRIEEGWAILQTTIISISESGRVKRIMIKQVAEKIFFQAHARYSAISCVVVCTKAKPYLIYEPYVISCNIMFSSFWRGKRVPVQDIGSWSAEDCLLDICLLVLSMLKLLVSSMLKDIGGGRVGILPICNSLC